MAEQIKMLFGVNNSGGPRNIVLDVGHNLPTERMRGPILNFEIPPISGTAEARDLKFCVHIKGRGLTKTVQR